MKRPRTNRHDRTDPNGPYMPKSPEDINPLKGLCVFLCLVWSVLLAIAGLWAWAVVLALLPVFLWALCWIRRGRPPISFTYAGVLGCALQFGVHVALASLSVAVMLASLVEDSALRTQVAAWAEGLDSEMGREREPDDPFIQIVAGAISILLLAILIGATQWIWRPAWTAASYPSRMAARLAQYWSHEFIDDHADSIPLPPRLSRGTSFMMKRRYLYRGAGPKRVPPPANAEFGR